MKFVQHVRYKNNLENEIRLSGKLPALKFSVVYCSTDVTTALPRPAVDREFPVTYSALKFSCVDVECSLVLE